MDHSCEKTSVTLLFIILTMTWVPGTISSTLQGSHKEIENWAWRFGRHIYELSRKIAHVDDIVMKYSEANVDRVDGTALLKEMVSDLEKLVASKIQAIQRIAETAEEAVTGYEYDETLEFDYFNAKNLDESKLALTPNKRFDNIRVNLSHSTVHVATNVYDENPEVLNAIKCSELLDPTFQSNHDHDPKLLWQYFGSSKGFLRHYPGIKWSPQLTHDKEAADTYDCRMRPWYIEAAASSKDIVVLLDISGSMTGLRYAIAQHVVVNILETLTLNDYVGVFKFSNSIENVVECFGNTLVSASKENLELIKDAIVDIELRNMTRFDYALTLAFDLLLNYTETEEGSCCNQAIMLISDGAPSTFEEIFLKYNQPHRRVRLFTYLIGREVTEYAEMKWMACTHRGYYTHVTTLAEVREQVEKYIPVMARPLALEQTHSYIWTPVYADIADPKVSGWLFENRERRKRKQRLLRKMHLFQLYGDEIFQAEESELQTRSHEDGDGELWVEDEFSANEIKKEIYESMEHYQLMTTVSVPVFNQCNVIITERILVNGTWTEHSEETNKADLLGVAGTDVPIKQLLQLTPAYKIGVSGYPFVVTNNGHLVTHPDLRPLYEGLLKIGYSSVDIADVELGDEDFLPWERSLEIVNLRKNMIDRKNSSTSARVRVLYDNMKRIISRKNNYFYAPIKNTPFTIGIALPDDVGKYRVRASLDIKQATFNVVSVFEGLKWRIHPDWTYCEYLYASSHPDRTPEENLIHFLSYIQTHKREFAKEKMQRVKDPPKIGDENQGGDQQKDETKATSDYYYCDRELLYNLLFDATATNVFGKKQRPVAVDVPSNETDLAHNHGVSVLFVATRSGLTRWEDLVPDEELANMTDPHFINLNSRAIDEIWYKRAVEQYLVNNTTFVFSVPFDAYRRNDTYITGTFAIFVESGDGKAPAAVAGLQFKHSVFSDVFLKNFTSDCHGQNCSLNCSSEDYDCYLIDDNGFVVFSEHYKDTGRFFGDVEGKIMQTLVDSGAYHTMSTYDFQASCVVSRDPANAASFLFTPVRYLAGSITWLLKKLALLYINYNVFSWWDLSWLSAWASNVEDSNEFHRYMDMEESTHHIIKPCILNVTLFKLNVAKVFKDGEKGKFVKCNPEECDRSFSYNGVPYTNMILLVVDMTCPCNENSKVVSTIVPSRIELPEEITICDMLNIHGYRARPTNKCLKSHPDESKITECGRGCNLTSNTIVLILSTLIIIAHQYSLQPSQHCYS